MPIDSTTFSPLESLGYGGLGIGWGLQCWEFSKQEQEIAGLKANRMAGAYEVVSARIGISATHDEAADYTLGSLKTFQPSPAMDRNHQRIYANYQRQKSWFDEQHVVMGRTPLALLTEDTEDRKGYQYRDLDFYSDQDLSAWRPWITVNKLRKAANFTYMRGRLVTRYEDEADGVTVYCLDTDNATEVSYRCRKLVLAAGALSSARIVLRSHGADGVKLPLLCNPYTYIPCLQPSMVGKAAEPRKLGFGQLSVFVDPKQTNLDISIATLYGYQSLMLFRTIKQLPLNLADARVLMQYLVTGLVIMGVQHTDHPTPSKYISLVADTQMPTGDKLQANYELSSAETQNQHDIESRYMAAMRKVKTYPLKRLYPGHGSSVHYAGTLPYSKQDKPFTLSPSGRVHGSRHVYVADSAGFNFLPARGLTFSLMANAHLTAQEVLKNA